MIESKLLQSGLTKIAGVDEAGRGACAGPLVVAAVILKDITDAKLAKVRDSKELKPGLREELFEVIVDQSSYQQDKRVGTLGHILQADP